MEDRNALERFARDLVPRLKAIPGHGIRSVDWSVSVFSDFVREQPAPTGMAQTPPPAAGVAGSDRTSRTAERGCAT
jgi:hypothetical protein